jgi:hypothetical protein
MEVAGRRQGLPSGCLMGAGFGVRVMSWDQGLVEEG